MFLLFVLYVFVVFFCFVCLLGFFCFVCLLGFFALAITLRRNNGKVYIFTYDLKSLPLWTLYLNLGAVVVVIAWIYNYLCNNCLSPLKLWAGIPLRSRSWHMILELRRHQFFKRTTIQPRPLPETIFQRLEIKLLRTIITVENMEY